MLTMDGAAAATNSAAANAVAANAAAATIVI